MAMWGKKGNKISPFWWYFVKKMFFLCVQQTWTCSHTCSTSFNRLFIKLPPLCKSCEIIKVDINYNLYTTVQETHVNSTCNQGKATSTIFKEQEEEKKRKYQQRVLDVEMGSFTPLVFGTNGGMGADCNCFLKRLAEKLSEKNEEPYHITITWIRTLLSFEILRSVHTCVRGSRTPFHKIPQGDFIDDCHLNATQAHVIMARARKSV